MTKTKTTNLKPAKDAKAETVRINEIFCRLQKIDPAPDSELNYKDNFTLLVAVMLSAQSTDKAVNKATKDLFKAADTPEKMVKIPLEELEKYIKTIGLFHTKAKNIINMAALLISRHNSKVPDSLDELINLPGVGRKTANVVLNTAFNKLVIAVDTHVHRVSNRLNLTNSKTPIETEKQLMKAIPEKFLRYAHHWLILHGRYTCISRKPLCAKCAVFDLCNFQQKML